MSTVYLYSEKGKSSGVTLSAVSGLGDKKLCRLTYHVRIQDTATAGVLYFSFKYKDPDGITQTYTSPIGLSVSSLGKIGNVVPFWTEDSSGAGAYFAYEIMPLSILGSYKYDYWLEVDEVATEL